jgi:hypothetical protein
MVCELSNQTAICQFNSDPQDHISTYFANLTHCGQVTQICAFKLQLCRTGDANLCF